MTYSDNHAIALNAHLESADRPPVLALNVTQIHDVLLDRHELLARIPLLKQRNHLARGHWRLEGHRHRRHDAAEPRRDRGDERDLERRAVRAQRRQVEPRLALVDVPRERVRAHERTEARRGHLGNAHGLAGGVLLHDRAGAAVSGHAEDRGECAGSDVVDQGREEELGGGRVAAGVRNALRGADRLTAVEFFR